MITKAQFPAEQSAGGEFMRQGDAFRDWVTKSKPAFWAAVRQEAKESTFGVCVFNNDRGPVSVFGTRLHFEF